MTEYPHHRTHLSRRQVLAATGALAGAGMVLNTHAPASAVVTVRASDYGFDPVDSTTALQAALDEPTAERVVIDNVGADWNTGPLTLNRSGVAIVLERGVTLRALSDAFPGDTFRDSQKLLTMRGLSDVTIKGYGATMAMDPADFPTGEWRHSLNILSCTNILVEGLTIDGSGGDGVYLGNARSTPYPDHNHQIVLRNLHCVNHRRDALSIISVRDLLIEGCRFADSVGTPPEGGIVLEPNMPEESLTGVEITDCLVTGNGSGITVNYSRLDETSQPIDVLVTRTTVTNQPGTKPAFCVYAPGTSDPGGSITAQDSLFSASVDSGAFGVYHKDAEGASVTSTNVSLWDIGTTSALNDTVVIWSPTVKGADPVPHYGGVTWTDVAVVTTHPTPFLSVREGSATVGLTGVHGSLTVVGLGADDTTEITQDLGAAPTEVDHVVVPLVEAVASTIALSTSTSAVVAGDTAVITVTRSSPDLSSPLSVLLTTGGSTRPRDDYLGSLGSVTIPAGEESADLLIRTRIARGQSYTRSLTLSAAPAPEVYSGGTTPVTITVTHG